VTVGIGSVPTVTDVGRGVMRGGGALAAVMV
jgi:hypothetical protein